MPYHPGSPASHGSHNNRGTLSFLASLVYLIFITVKILVKSIRPLYQAVISLSFLLLMLLYGHYHQYISTLLRPYVLLIPYSLASYSSYAFLCLCVLLALDIEKYAKIYAYLPSSPLRTLALLLVKLVVLSPIYALSCLYSSPKTAALVLLTLSLIHI